MRVLCIKTSISDSGIPSDLVPKEGRIYTVVEGRKGDFRLGSDVWYILAEFGYSVKHHSSIFEEIKLERNAATELALAGIKNFEHILN